MPHVDDSQLPVSPKREAQAIIAKPKPDEAQGKKVKAAMMDTLDMHEYSPDESLLEAAWGLTEAGNEPGFSQQPDTDPMSKFKQPEFGS